jgi:hypothetical protein
LTKTLLKYFKERILKAAKIIEDKLNGLYDVRFTFEFADDKNGNEIGMLAAPYVKWYSPDENAVWERVYTLSGEVLIPMWVNPNIAISSKKQRNN